jgi:hypothetical protein
MTWQNKLLFVNEANLNSKASQLFIVMVSQLVTNKNNLTYHQGINKITFLMHL